MDMSRQFSNERAVLAPRKTSIPLPPITLSPKSKEKGANPLSDDTYTPKNLALLASLLSDRATCCPSGQPESTKRKHKKTNGRHKISGKKGRKLPSWDMSFSLEPIKEEEEMKTQRSGAIRHYGRKTIVKPIERQCNIYPPRARLATPEPEPESDNHRFADVSIDDWSLDVEVTKEEEEVGSDTQSEIDELFPCRFDNHNKEEEDTIPGEHSYPTPAPTEISDTSDTETQEEERSSSPDGCDFETSRWSRTSIEYLLNPQTEDFERIEEPQERPERQEPQTIITTYTPTFNQFAFSPVPDLIVSPLRNVHQTPNLNRGSYNSESCTYSPSSSGSPDGFQLVTPHYAPRLPSLSRLPQLLTPSPPHLHILNPLVLTRRASELNQELWQDQISKNRTPKDYQPCLTKNRASFTNASSLQHYHYSPKANVTELESLIESRLRTLDLSQPRHSAIHSPTCEAANQASSADVPTCSAHPLRHVLPLLQDLNRNQHDEDLFTQLNSFRFPSLKSSTSASGPLLITSNALQLDIPPQERFNALGFLEVEVDGEGRFSDIISEKSDQDDESSESEYSQESEILKEDDCCSNSEEENCSKVGDLGYDEEENDTTIRDSAQGYFSHIPPSSEPGFDHPSRAAAALRDHKLNAEFAERFIIGDQLGFGGYGFVVSAIDLFATHQNEVHVAVKFVFKSRMEESDKAEMVDKLPKEAYVLSQVRHPGIILLLAVYEDEKFYYYVTELHGDSWRKGAKTIEGQHYLEYLALSKRPSQLPIFPEGHFNPPIAQHVSSRRTQPRVCGESYSMNDNAKLLAQRARSPLLKAQLGLENLTPSPSLTLYTINGGRKDEEKNLNERTVPPQMIHTNSQEKPNMERRPSYDLFECCEHVRFTDDQAKNIFRQIVQAVAYLHMRGIYHRDLKDENIVIDRYLRVKLIDFGSAVLEDDFDNPIQYSMYRGTAAYAPPEISRGMYYEAAKCDVWALGVILSILLTGSVPFPHVNDAEAGRMVLKRPISKQAESLMRLCLTVEAEERPNIWKVKAHPWLRQAQLVF